MASSHHEVKKISTDLKSLSHKIEQLENRKKILCVFQELRNRAEFGQTEEAAATQDEINDIDDKLKELLMRKAELQKICDNYFKSEDQIKSDTRDNCEKDPCVDTSADKVFFVEPPPSYPAPSVILDVKHLPAYSAKTKCPECNQFVTTETFSSVSSVTWLVCFMTAMVGCVAGCCLLPFCMEKFKTITHRCPKCRTKITSIKKL